MSVGSGLSISLRNVGRNILAVKNVDSEARQPESSLTSFLTLDKLLNLSDVEVLICTVAIRMSSQECWEDSMR